MSIDSITLNPPNSPTNNCKNTSKDLSLKETINNLGIRDSHKGNPCNQNHLEQSSPTGQNHAPRTQISCSRNLEPENSFLFDSSPRTVRFTWKIDAQGHLNAVSEELSQTIGTYALKMIGMHLCDINHILQIDSKDHLFDLLTQQNTWYSKTTFWPIEGTDLHVPIDLAALPIYSRDREFVGFKGFGIIRVNQTKNDPKKLGTTLGEKFSQSHEIKKVHSFIKKENSPSLPYQTIPAHLDIKDRGSFPSGYFPKDKDDNLATNKKNYFSKRDNFHTINLNQYIEKYPHPKESFEDSFQINHPSLSTYFGEGENLTPEIVDKHPISLFVCSKERLLYASPSFLLLAGYKSVEDIEKVGGVSMLLDAQKLSNGNTHGSITLHRSDGTNIAVSAHLHTIQWNRENSLAMTFVPFEKNNKLSDHISQNEIKSGYNNTRTDANKMEIEIMQLCSILESTSDGIAIVNRDGTILSTNRAIGTLFDYPAQDIIGKPFKIFFTHDNQIIMNHCMAEISSIDLGKTLEKTAVGCTREGKLISLRITMKKLPFSACYCLILHDISEWKQEKNELYHAKKMAEKENSHKNDFLARVSHEIRTPLTAIIGFSEVIKNQRFGPVGSPRYIEYANYIDRSGNLVLDIVNDLLDISKIESGKMNFHFESVSLNETISEAISLMELYANEKRILVRTSFSNDIPPIFADLRSIKQIALNILSNAIHFTPSGGQIVISTAYTRNKEVVLRVKDTGIGMTDYELEKAMKPFGQIPNSQQVRGEGTGLGLPLTKAMVDANMGKFSVFSTPSKGTLIEIIFTPQKTA
ncbi:PAS/PAC sensor signal transduction histidine kinase [Candidatus Liberibacter solanacearum CLso-ZC1]|uniref:histidine kinase n=1 Tax=Liberibacter solanacearum (strain CLso-ZC1) TaxID=658172 RepID=E4UCQ3_LIBSC|nr:ATP-binding protein [Candidatus Liberibacter solanacearum]ADR52144.1 PAS/PAC sensor signal transduction histidine kinase [Candidatus Liberibacter solanacearum CLso-ZC1]